MFVIKNPRLMLNLITPLQSVITDHVAVRDTIGVLLPVCKLDSRRIPVLGSGNQFISSQNAPYSRISSVMVSFSPSDGQNGIFEYNNTQLFKNFSNYSIKHSNIKYPNRDGVSTIPEAILETRLALDKIGLIHSVSYEQFVRDRFLIGISLKRDNSGILNFQGLSTKRSQTLEFNIKLHDTPYLSDTTTGGATLPYFGSDSTALVQPVDNEFYVGEFCNMFIWYDSVLVLARNTIIQLS
jgi:hypothetical protein